MLLIIRAYLNGKKNGLSKAGVDAMSKVECTSVGKDIVGRKMEYPLKDLDTLVGAAISCLALYILYTICDIPAKGIGQNS